MGNAVLPTVRIDDVAEARPALVRIGLAGLEHLDLGSTGVGDGLFAEVITNGSLKTLRLDHTTVSDKSIQSLAALHGLKEIDLTGTAVSPAGIARLQAMLPGCRVLTDSKR